MSTKITDEYPTEGKWMGDGLFFVLAVNLIVWAGIVVYLFSLDNRLKKIEKPHKQEEEHG